MRSRHGWRQFLLAALCGIVVTAAVGGVYLSGAWHAAKAPAAAVIAETEKSVSEYITTNDLPTYYLDIPFKAMQTLAAQRDVALERGVLNTTDDDWQRATLRYLDNSISVRVKLKGDWLDHLGEKKWSFHVDTRNNQAFLGMRSFSLQSPATRGYLNEWLYLSELRRAGVLAPRYAFANLVVNGERWGLYAVEEGFSKELLESAGRRESVIVRFDESRLWQRTAWSNPDEQAGGWDPAANYASAAYAEADEFNTTRVQSDPVLSVQSRAALGLLRGYQSGALGASEVFDVDLMGRFLAQTTLWHAGHALVWFNMRYYYNPLTTRLEPIGYDALALRSETFVEGLAQFDELQIAQAYAREARRIADPAFLSELQTRYSAEFERYHAALLQEFAPADLEPPWETLKSRGALLAAVFVDQTQPVYAYRAQDGAASALHVQVGNILAHPVALERLSVADVSVPIAPEWLSQSDGDLIYAGQERVILKRAHEVSPRYVTLTVPAELAAQLLPASGEVYTDTLQLVARVIGLDEPYSVTVQSDYPPVQTGSVLPERPTLSEALQRHPFLTEYAQDVLAVRPGIHDVDGDLVLPQGYALRAEGGTTLRFDESAVFLVSGALTLDGTDAAPVRLLPKAQTWAGLVVLQAGEAQPSRLAHVEISGTAGIDRSGWFTTGGVTFYESPVTIERCTFAHSTVEDGLNIIRSEMAITGTHFANLSSDAFDGDFVHGYVANCTFSDIRGDCVDVSGSQVTVTDVSVQRIADKAVSVGEGSTVTLDGLRAREVGIAIASKDMSTVEARNVYVHRAAYAALAAYIKKLEYGSASINVANLVISDASAPAVAQFGSSIRIDGRPVSPTSLDVGALYALLEARGGQQALSYRLGPSIRLTGCYLATPSLRSGESLHLVLEWQADGLVDLDYTVFVHLLDAGGGIVRQHDGMPAGGTRPTKTWALDTPVYDSITIDLPADLPVGEYRLVTGMYHWHTPDQRLAVLDEAEAAVPNNAILLPVTVSVVP